MDSRFICRGDILINSGTGFRFAVRRGGQTFPAFVVRFGGRARAFLNRCAHIGLELDILPGELFDHTGRFLICATHGARYDPVSGECRSGPCRGGGLVRLPVEEVDGGVRLTDNSDYQLI